MSALDSARAQAAARSYGWNVYVHDHGGFSASLGGRCMIVAFDEAGVFRTACIAHSPDGSEESIREGGVIGALVQYGDHERVQPTP